MPQSPQWTKVLISGSNFEVNSLTSSVDLPLLNTPDATSKSVVFRDPITGGWETTSSIRFLKIETSFYLDIGGTTPNAGDHAFNVPDSSITASTVGVPVEDPSNDLISFPTIFKNATYGGFEHTASVAYDPVLEFYGLQTTNLNNSIKSGSTLEGPSPAQLATFPLKGETQPNFPLTFANSWIYNNTTTYIDDSGNGDYMKFNRSMPVGTGITASFKVPFYYDGAFQGQFIKAQLRRWLPGGYSIGGEYIDEDEITVDIDTFKNRNGWNEFTPLPVSESFTGSWEIESTLTNPIQEDERWQLRIRGHENYSIGYNNSDDDDNVGNFRFEITGSTATPGPQLTGNFSGSFVGSQYGGYSGSLSGVTLNSIPSNQGITRGNGLLFYEKGKSGQYIQTFVGDNPTDMILRLYPAGPTNIMADGYNKSGFTFPNLSESEIINGDLESGSLAGGLELGDGLAGTGLSFSEGSNKEILSLDLDTDSGLTVGNTRLKINDSIAGDGLEGGFGSGQPGSMSINLATGQSGLAFGEIGSEPDAIALATSLPGYGLKYGKTGDHSEIDIDTNQIPLATNKIIFKSATSPTTLGVGNIGSPVGLYYSSVDVTYNNNSTTQQGTLGFYGDSVGTPGTTAPEISKNIEISGSVLIKGDFTVVDNSNVTSIWAQSFETTDQFIRLSSGSVNTYPFSKDNAGLIIQDEPLDGSGNASGSAIFGDFGGVGDNLFIGSKEFVRIGWGVTKGRVPWDATTPFDNFIAQTDVGDLTSSVDYVSALATNKWGGGAPSDTDTYFIDNDTLGQTIGSFWVDTSVDPSGNDSNVYIFGLFE